MKLHLVDVDEALVTAWRVAFADCLEVTVQRADILSVARVALVSPANSYGHMDGGIVPPDDAAREMAAAYRDWRATT